MSGYNRLFNVQKGLIQRVKCGFVCFFPAASMAPRGRARKRRLTRMDAAIDAMTPFGFSEKLVRKIARELLKEYGGDEGWFFLEQDSYEVLREALLRDVEENDQEKNAQAENHMENESKDGTPAGASSVATDSLQDTEIPDHSPVDAVGSSSSVPLTCAEGVGISSVIPAGQETGKGWKDIGLDKKYTHKESDVHECDPRTGKSSIPSSPLMIPSPTTIPRRRRPCYGWLESDEEDDPNDIIYLQVQLESTPKVLRPDISVNFGIGTNSNAKRKSRWDEKPDDP
ncbi:putative inactive histone-lysine N-methyltransferase SUVR1 [Forsythia ovata]|uniref:Inactive histone-lysine N-methyltransferase SUVR1 n=1 Tax=Forsythia ovata TaxID=205694 RepID=A0ABD1R6E2_9LAMI